MKRAAAALAAVLAGFAMPATALARYAPPPRGDDSWYWEIDPPKAGLAGLPATDAPYPAPGSARIWDTDLFEDANTSSGAHNGIPTGPSRVVTAVHAAGHYSVCYVEAGAFQAGFPDDGDFAAVDYGAKAKRYEMRGYADEWWFDISGFRAYVSGEPSTLTGAAPNIAAALSRRFAWCRLEGQDAVESDDLDGYTNRSETGVAGGGWGLTQADSAGFERWIANQVHADHMAVLQKNDVANAAVDEPLFDGVITEECNLYTDPCAGRGGDWDSYLARGKPVLNAEYTQDGETAAKFCAADDAHRIWGALFSVDLNGAGGYKPCWSRTGRL